MTCIHPTKYPAGCGAGNKGWARGSGTVVCFRDQASGCTIFLVTKMGYVLKKYTPLRPRKTFRRCHAGNGKEMYQDVQSTCGAFVLKPSGNYLFKNIIFVF